MRKTLDLGFPMVRFDQDRSVIEFLTPVECDPDGLSKREAQFIGIYTEENIGELRNTLNELWPPPIVEELNKLRTDYHKQGQELIKVNGENAYLKGMMHDMELKMR